MMHDNPLRRESFAETPEYVDRLIRRCTEKAVLEGRCRRQRTLLRRRIVAAAAAVILIAGPLILWGLKHTAPDATALQTTMTETAAGNGPVEEYLARISDEEAQLLIVYEIEDVPEY